MRGLLGAGIAGGCFWCGLAPATAQTEAAPQAAQGLVTQQAAPNSPPSAQAAKAAAVERGAKKRVAKPAHEKKSARARNDKTRPSAPAGDASPADKPPASGSAALAHSEPAEPRPTARPALVVDGASIANVADASKGPEIEVRVSPSQQRENAYRSAVNTLNDGRADDAARQLRSILAGHPGHDNARQALIGLALKQRQFAQAEALADERLEHGAEHLGFAVVSARLKLDRADAAGAVDVLKRSELHARSNAEFQALMAAVLQRLSRHAEAAERFRAALALQPASGVWSMGLGVSLQALERSGGSFQASPRRRESVAGAASLRRSAYGRAAPLDGSGTSCPGRRQGAWRRGVLERARDPAWSRYESPAGKAR